MSVLSALTLLAVLGCAVIWLPGNPVLQAQTSTTYPPGWDLVSGPEGSVLQGAVGSLYTLQPGDVGYETLPATSPLHDGVGYYAYFPAGGAIRFGSGTSYYSERVSQPQWLMVGNPSASATALIYGDVQAQQYTLAPGQATFVWTSGLVLVNAAAPTPVPGANALQSGPPPTPIPTCVDGQYGAGAAGTDCRVTGQTQPTALCYDGTLDYSRTTFACAGHGGVANYLPSLPDQNVPPAPLATVTATATAFIAFP